MRRLRSRITLTLAGSPRSPTDRPNVLLINCDDLGYGDLGCYGSQANDTPVLDRLAEEGLRLTDFYMASPVCSPSRAALLTGCYPPRIGFGDFDGFPVLFPGHRYGLHPDEVTIAGVLRAAGYATKAVGKWHCGDQQPFLPTRHGFDSWYGIPYSNDMGRQAEPESGPSLRELLAQLGMQLPLDDFPPLPVAVDDTVIEAQPDQSALTARFVDEGVRFMRERRDRPWFLYLAHIYVHLPLYVSDEHMERSRNGRYGGAVAAIDWAAGVLLAELDSLGLEESTVVVFTSDNGSRARGEGGSNDPLRGTKGSTWEGGQRVPCLVRWPGQVASGNVTSEVATAMDLLPTLARLAGAELSDDRVIDGRDITSVLLDGGLSPHEAFFYYRGNDLEAVRAGRWKLHLAKAGHEVEELYDLESDVGERINRFADEPAVVQELTALAGSIRTRLGDGRLGLAGTEVRPVGEVDDQVPLATFDPEADYFMAEYDLSDRG